MRIVDLFREGAPASVHDAVDAMEIVLVTTCEMWENATSALLYNDQLLIDLEEVDKIVDTQERTIRKLVYDYVGTHPKRDLGLSLMIISIVQDGERIGDLAKSIGGLCDLAAAPLIGPLTSSLRLIRDRITTMFHQTKAGFIDGDVEAAKQVMKENRDIKLRIRSLISELAADEQVTVNESVILASAGLMMGRVSSHLSNIASTVVLPFEQIRSSSPDPSEG